MRSTAQREAEGLRSSRLEAGAEAVRDLLHEPGVEAVQIPRPGLGALPYQGFVRALLRAPGFKLDLRGQAPEATLAMVADRLFGAGSFAAERAVLARDICALSDFAAKLCGDARPLVAIRTYFAPGDLVWHVDRLNERKAFRLLWALGRPAGMRVTPADNIDPAVYRGFMRREFSLLGQLDTRVLHTGAAVESLWAHRPAQLDAMRSGRFPFILDPTREWAVDAAAASVHRVETPAARGTYHRSSWENRRSPGVQIVVTVASD
jgi:hypothetical protein